MWILKVYTGFELAIYLHKSRRTNDCLNCTYTTYTFMKLKKFVRFHCFKDNRTDFITFTLFLIVLTLNKNCVYQFITGRASFENDLTDIGHIFQWTSFTFPICRQSTYTKDKLCYSLHNCEKKEFEAGFRRGFRFNKYFSAMLGHVQITVVLWFKHICQVNGEDLNPAWLFKVTSCVINAELSPCYFWILLHMSPPLLISDLFTAISLFQGYLKALSLWDCVCWDVTKNIGSHLCLCLKRASGSLVLFFVFFFLLALHFP